MGKVINTHRTYHSSRVAKWDEMYDHISHQLPVDEKVVYNMLLHIYVLMPSSLLSNWKKLWRK